MSLVPKTVKTTASDLDCCLTAPRYWDSRLPTNKLTKVKTILNFLFSFSLIEFFFFMKIHRRTNTMCNIRIREKVGGKTSAKEQSARLMNYKNNGKYSNLGFNFFSDYVNRHVSIR